MRQEPAVIKVERPMDLGGLPPPPGYAASRPLAEQLAHVAPESPAPSHSDSPEKEDNGTQPV